MAVANPFSFDFSLCENPCETFLIFELTLITFFPFSDCIITAIVFLTRRIAGGEKLPYSLGHTSI